MTSILLSIGRYLGLTKECPFGERHWRWARLCDHGFGEESDDEEFMWHGGLLDLKLSVELHPCVHCTPAYSLASRQFALNDEELHLLTAWRRYRMMFLDAMEDGSYKYTIGVDVNGVKQDIMERTTGFAILKETKDMFPRPIDDKMKVN